ncbi:hypothetical protein HPP92_020872 [Vanilla planifolia]|uniref:Uncharacterized protein n=1 Tax=Vanilla planifolia TaxID=51239 RepID=A0A835PXN4_VANPL|nr:hypothetical protein HPP92_020872 [Vanilla planifolia]
MADAAEKDVETRTSSTPSPLTPAVTPASPTSGVEGVTDGEADDRDRFARDLKAGLHPLKAFVDNFWGNILSNSFDLSYHKAFDTNLEMLHPKALHET